MSRVNPRLQAQLSRKENAQAYQRKMALLLEAPTIEEIAAVRADYIFISVGMLKRVLRLGII